MLQYIHSLTNQTVMKNVLKVTYILILAVLLNIAFIWITNKPTHYVETITTQNNVVLEQTYSINEYNCVVQALYHEARGEGKEGVLAVASVIQNRVLSGVYPDEHCQVIHQPKQFSYVHELRNKGQSLDVNPRPTEQEIYEFIQVVAKDTEDEADETNKEGRNKASKANGLSWVVLRCRFRCWRRCYLWFCWFLWRLG